MAAGLQPANPIVAAPRRREPPDCEGVSVCAAICLGLLAANTLSRATVMEAKFLAPSA